MTSMTPTPDPLRDEDVARLFHDAYERLAPSFGYETRKASAVPWSDVPEPNRLLMVAVASEVRAALAQPAPALDAERLAADALLNWYDTTHGNEFGHDHHCPVPQTENPHTAVPDAGCTCGWSSFLHADAARLTEAPR